MTTFISFAQRRNDDRSLDSTCTRCYRTVAKSLNADEISEAEASHQCDPEVWRDWSQFHLTRQQSA